MWMNIAVVFVLVIIVLATNNQGFFSNVLQLACTVVAGAIAFAAWEPMYYIVIAKLDKPFWYDFGWGLSLLIVFALARILLLLVSDKACPANVFLTDQPNWIGSGIVGAMNAIVITGVLVIGLQYVQGPTKIAGYQAWRVDADGSIRREDKLWVPVDQIVEYIYSKGSLGPMFVPYPMAELHPNLSQDASLFRISYGEGASRMGMMPNGVEAKELIQMQTPRANFIRDLPGTLDPRTGDKFVDGDLYVVRSEFNNATWDGGSRLRISKAQVGLIVETDDGQYLTIHPHAFYQKYNEALPFEWRFEFDTNDVFATSVGVGAVTKIGFEFLVPPRSSPRYLVVRNMRADLPSNVESMSYDAVVSKAQAGQF